MVKAFFDREREIPGCSGADDNGRLPFSELTPCLSIPPFAVPIPSRHWGAPQRVSTERVGRRRFRRRRSGVRSIAGHASIPEMLLARLTPSLQISQK